MMMTRPTSTPHLTRKTLVLLAFTMLLTAGCSAFDTTNNSSNTNNGSCNGAGGGNSVNCSGGQTSGTTAVSSIGTSFPAAPPTPATPAGKKLGEYTITLPEGTYVPIGPNPPTRSQESTTPTPSSDLEFYVLSGVAVFLPNNPFSTIAPYSGGIPTYGGCQADLDTQSQVGANQGNAFCLYEKQTSRTVGGIVTATQASAINPNEVEVEFTIWSGTS